MSSAISSPASRAGRSRYRSLAGRQMLLFGLPASPASRSATRANGKAKKTRGTCGRSSGPSSRSAGLQRSLENKLRANLDVNGSIEYRLTWKHWDMPSGRRICALRAQARRTSDSVCTGWPTPKVRDERGVNTPETLARKRAAGHGCSDLVDTAMLAGWRTPESSNADQGGKEFLNHDLRVTLTDQVMLVGWATPATRDYRYPNKRSYADRGGRSGAFTQLNDQAFHLGTISSSSPAATASCGVLDAAFSRWLQGFPSAWDEASPGWTAYASTQRGLIESVGSEATETPLFPR